MPKLSLAQVQGKMCEGKVKNTQTPDDLTEYVLRLLGPDHPVENSDFVSPSRPRINKKNGRNEIRNEELLRLRLRLCLCSSINSH